MLRYEDGPEAVVQLRGVSSQLLGLAQVYQGLAVALGHRQSQAQVLLEPGSGAVGCRGMPWCAMAMSWETSCSMVNNRG